MDAEGALPGVSDQVSEDRIVLHVDNDCFYAACERLREPDLVDKPVVVGMGYEPGETIGAVATASYEAREYGVESAQSITEAMERLPPASQVEDEDGPVGYYRSVDMNYYESKAQEVTAILEDHAETVRKVSIDEAYLACPEEITWDEATSLASHIKDEIAERVGLPVSIGVAPNMSVAKIASDHDKPNGLVVVPPSEVRSFLEPLPISALHGIGPVTEAELQADGIETIGDLAATDQELVSEAFGDRGRELHRRARGIDPRAVTPRGDPKSLSRESAFAEPTTAFDQLSAKGRELAQAVAARAAEKGATYRTIGIKVVTPPFEINTRERSLPGPVEDPDLVEEVALELLEEFTETRVRKIGVRVSNLSFTAGDQTQLGSWAKEEAARSQENTPDPLGGQATLSQFTDDRS